MNARVDAQLELLSAAVARWFDDSDVREELARAFLSRILSDAEELPRLTPIATEVVLHRATNATTYGWPRFAEGELVDIATALATRFMLITAAALRDTDSGAG